MQLSPTPVRGIIWLHLGQSPPVLPSAAVQRPAAPWHQTLRLQSSAKVSSTVRGLARNAPRVRLSTARSKLVGVILSVSMGTRFTGGGYRLMALSARPGQARGGPQPGGRRAFRTGQYCDHRRADSGNDEACFPLPYTQ